MEKSTDAPSKPNVLRQSGEDQAGGVVWRWKDGDNYYVARANALENNVTLYYTANGKRNTLKYVDAPVKGGQWHELTVEFAGNRIQVPLDGKKYIDLPGRRVCRCVHAKRELAQCVGALCRTKCRELKGNGKDCGSSMGG